MSFHKLFLAVVFSLAFAHGAIALHSIANLDPIDGTYTKDLSMFDGVPRFANSINGMLTRDLPEGSIIWNRGEYGCAKYRVRAGGITVGVWEKNPNIIVIPACGNAGIIVYVPEAPQQIVADQGGYDQGGYQNSGYDVGGFLTGLANIAAPFIPQPQFAYASPVAPIVEKTIIDNSDNRVYNNSFNTDNSVNGSYNRDDHSRTVIPPVDHHRPPNPGPRPTPCPQPTPFCTPVPPAKRFVDTNPQSPNFGNRAPTGNPVEDINGNLVGTVDPNSPTGIAPLKKGTRTTTQGLLAQNNPSTSSSTGLRDLGSRNQQARQAKAAHAQSKDVASKGAATSSHASFAPISGPQSQTVGRTPRTRSTYSAPSTMSRSQVRQTAPRMQQRSFSRPQTAPRRAPVARASAPRGSGKRR